jgi:hypothetical protein
MVFIIAGCKKRTSGDSSTATNISKTEMRMPVRKTESGLELIRVSEDGRRFVSAESGERFFGWGFNYDHDDSGRLIEDYWYEEWATVAEDFKEMKALGANVVRIHPQVAKFMKSSKEPNEAALKQLVRMVRLVEKTGIYLDITGLGCYHKEDVPKWYDAMDEAGRWEVQALFWEAIAKNCAESPAVFCYDLMNEPILPGDKEKESEWLTGELGGKYFVQRISLYLAGRTRKQVARMWVDKLSAAIRKHDKHHMITVGVIPWAHTFPKARPLFYSKEVGVNLDFVSVHFYPKKGEVNKALTVEETSPLYCGQEEFDVFVDESLDIVDGYVGFYWGKTIEEYSVPNVDIAGEIMRDWLEYFRAKGLEILGARSIQDRQ